MYQNEVIGDYACDRFIARGQGTLAVNHGILGMYWP